LRAEYLYAGGAADFARIAFNFTSGDRVAFARWAEGWRPVVVHNRVSWQRSGARGTDRAQFADYLQTVFTYAGSKSLERELVPVGGRKAEGGDVFIEGGFPGHAVIVVDAAEDPNGRRVMLLAQSFMPAQSVHVLKNPAGGVWYDAAAGDPETPEWKFRAGHACLFPGDVPLAPPDCSGLPPFSPSFLKCSRGRWASRSPAKPWRQGIGPWKQWTFATSHAINTPPWTTRRSAAVPAWS